MGCLCKASAPSSLNRDRRHTTQGDIVKVGGQLDCLDFSTDIVVVYMIVKVCNSRVCTIICSKHLLRLFDLVWSVNIFDYRVSVSMVEWKKHVGPTSDGSERCLVSWVTQHEPDARFNAQPLDVRI